MIRGMKGRFILIVGVLVVMFFIGSVSALTNYAASANGGVSSVVITYGTQEGGTVLANIHDENDATYYGVTRTTNNYYDCTSDFIATIMFSQTASEITSIDYRTAFFEAGEWNEWYIMEVDILQGGTWNRIADWEDLTKVAGVPVGSLSGSWQNVDGIRARLLSNAAYTYGCITYVRLFELKAWGPDLGPSCGDGSCNGVETCGDTNVAPECNSDCGACPVTGSCGEIDDSRLIMRLSQNSDAYGSLWNGSGGGGSGGGISFGTQTVGTSSSSLGERICGGIYTAPQDGFLDNMSLYIASDWDSGEKIKCAIYDQSKNFLASTEERSDGGSGWQTFSFVSPVSVGSGQNYSLVCLADSSVTMRSESGSSGNYFQTANYGSWPSTLGSAGSAYEKSVYATYGSIGGSVYDVEVCYPTSFASYSGSSSTVHDCSGSNKVLGLMDVFDSYAEIPEGTTYINDVCYGDLVCRSDLDSSECATWNGEVILSLVDVVNSPLALGDFAGYDIKICCSDNPGTLPTSSVLEWRDLNGNNITSAQVGDTVMMVMTEVGVGTFEIFEDDVVIDDSIRTGGNAISGVVSGSDVVGLWTINADDLAKTPGDYGEFYFVVNGENSAYLNVDSSAADDPMNISILSPACGEDFDKGDSVFISVSAEDSDDVIVGNVTVNGAVNSFSNGGLSFNHNFDIPGNHQVVVQASNGKGERSRSIASIMVLDKAGGFYVDGDYVAACITKPADFSNIPGSIVSFDASGAKGIRVSGGTKNYVLPGDPRLDFYWSFFPDGRTYGEQYAGTGNSLAYKFITEFAVAGDNSAVLRVEMN